MRTKEGFRLANVGETKFRNHDRIWKRWLHSETALLRSISVKQHIIGREFSICHKIRRARFINHIESLDTSSWTMWENFKSFIPPFLLIIFIFPSLFLSMMSLIASAVSFLVAGVKMLYGFISQSPRHGDGKQPKQVNKPPSVKTKKAVATSKQYQYKKRVEGKKRHSILDRPLTIDMSTARNRPRTKQEEDRYIASLMKTTNATKEEATEWLRRRTALERARGCY